MTSDNARSQECSRPAAAPGGTLGCKRPVDPDAFLDHMAKTGQQRLEVAGVSLRPGSRVRLRPRPGGDLLDAALGGRTALVAAIDEDDAGNSYLAVVLEDGLGRRLGGSPHPAHRFLFSPDEVEPVPESESIQQQHRVLVAGIGNVFLGDDGFGVAVAHELQGRGMASGIEVIDFGIRGRDLVYQLGQEYRAAILVDTVPSRGHPGALMVMQAKLEETTTQSFDGHRMDPVTVLQMARRIGPLPEQVLIVGCEADEAAMTWSEQTAMSLSAPVAAAVGQAADLVQRLAVHFAAGGDPLAAPTEKRQGE